MLSDDWCAMVIREGVDLAKPGIYRWEIQGAVVGNENGIDIGKYTRSSRPRHEYRRNVARILNGVDSHHKNGKFRRIHDALADAVRERRQITLTILANAEPADLNSLEQAFIKSERANLNGPVGRLLSTTLGPTQG